MGILFVFHSCISEKIKEHQQIHGSTKTWIANKAGLSRQSLNSLETTENPTIQALLRLAYALDCRIEDLYKYEIHCDYNEDA